MAADHFECEILFVPNIPSPFVSKYKSYLGPESEENHKDCQILCEDNEIKNEIKNTIMKIKMAKKSKEDVNADMLRLEQLLMFNTP